MKVRIERHAELLDSQGGGHDAHIRTYTRINKYVYIYTYIKTYTYIYIYVYIYTHMHAHTCLCTYIPLCIYVCIYSLPPSLCIYTYVKIRAAVRLVSARSIWSSAAFQEWMTF